MKAILLRPLVALLAILTLFTAPVVAAPQCTGLADALAWHHKQRGEVAIWQGMSPDGSALMIVANPDGSSWSALVLIPDGKKGCLLASGKNWQPGDAPPPAGEEG